MKLQVLASSVLVGYAVASTSLNATFDSSGCVSPSGFNACNAKVQAQESACDAGSGGNAETTLACTCVALLDEINCAVSQCWNEVYSCQYQALIIQYMEMCPSSGSNFPYFPAPDNAPGGCSCNIGQVYLNAANSLVEGGQKCKANPSVDELVACVCCEAASALTSIYGICPNTDPTLIGLSKIEADLAAFDEPFSSCAPYLSQYDCIKDLGFAPVGPSSTFVNPTSMPTTGTQTLFTTGGPITAPISATVTWSYANSEFTASAVAAGNSQASSGRATSGSPTSRLVPRAQGLGIAFALCTVLLGDYL